MNSADTQTQHTHPSKSTRLDEGEATQKTTEVTTSEETTYMTTVHSANNGATQPTTQVLNTPVETAGGVESASGHNAVIGRKRRIFRQFMQFGIVGASGFVVNQAIFVIVKKMTESGWGVHVEDPFLNLLGSEFHLRWYHVFSIIAFLVANVWNFCLNRFWTFKGTHKNAWWKQLPVFMAVGVFGLIITLLVQTALINPESPIALPTDIFDNSTGLRTKAYWGNFIGVIVAVPANFIFNKLWTFRGVKSKPAKVTAVKKIEPRETQPVADPAAGEK